MIILTVLFCLISFIVLWVIFTPVIIRINNQDSIYEIRQRGTFLAKAEFNEGFRLHFYLLGLELPKKTKSKEQKTIGDKKPKGKHFFNESFSKWRRFLSKLKKAISIKRLVLDIDTGDVVLNAQVIPVLYLLNNRQVTLNTNFVGRIFIEFIAYIYLHRVLWAFISFKLKH